MKKLSGIFGVSAMVWSALTLGAQTIPEQIETILARSAVANNSWTILIENEIGSVNFYQKNPTLGLAPASNTKIFTTSAAIGLLGTNHFFETRIYTNGTFSGGVLTGDLNLVSEHDMTWNTSVFSGNARKALDYIAGKLKTNGLTSVVGNIRCYGVCFYNRGSTDDTRDTQNQIDYNAEAAVAFKAALASQNITVSGSALGQSGFNPPGGLFYTHKSSDLTYGGKPLRLDVACIPLLKVSHNVMADQLLRHIGYKLSGTDSFVAGKNKVLPWLATSAGVTTNGIVMNDGSGLSHGNDFSARQTVTLVRYMIGAFPSWDDGLPIGCVDGTIGSRFCGTDGSGTVHAKTGSLSISIALSGYLDNKYDNRRYFFSFIGNRTSIDQDATRDAIDDCVVLIGGPLGPQLTSVTNVGNGSSVKVSWSDDKFIRTGYKLYSSADGTNYGSPIAFGQNVRSYLDNGLALGQKKYHRISATDNGVETLLSRAYGAQVNTARSRVLVVDGNDRWQSDKTDNPAANSHNFCAIAGQNISGPAFDTVDHDAVISGTIALTNYSAVVWLLGEESTANESFSSSEQTLITAYLNSGGNLFVSGAEIGWDSDRASGPTAADRTFYHTQLRAALNGDANDDALTYNITAVTNGIFSGNPATSFDNGTHGTYNVAFPDVLTPTNNSVAGILYSGGPGPGGAAAVVYDGAQGGGKLVNFGFPFETITSSSARDAYMSDVLRFFGVLDPVRLLPAQVSGSSIILKWTASAGIKYRVQFKTDLSSATWTDVAPDVTATNTTCSATQPIASGQKFYRVLLVN